VTDLAYFSGVPTFAEPLHVGRPNIGDRARFLEKVNDIFDRRWLSNNGTYARELESALAERLGVKHCLVVANGTIGLEIAVRALGLSGEVIVPAYTFIATAHALRWLGLTPVFCDVDPSTHTIDPVSAEKAITEQTTGIIGVHLWGQPCAIDPLQAIADKHDLALLYDAAHAFASTHDNRPIGSFGDLEVFSFHATKFFNTFEGGAITTNNAALAERVRLMRNFGFAGVDNVVSEGTNGKLNEVSAAMGLNLLTEIDTLLEVNRRNYQQYQCGLAPIPGIKLLEYANINANNCQYIVLEIDPAVIKRDTLLMMLQAENVRARRYFYPGCHRMEPYASQVVPDSWPVPVTEMLSERVLVLPGGATLDSAEIETICGLLKTFVEHADAIEAQIRLQ
jgi:dTDP-4-amino-4,6-dideoxygalactose transaminase